MTDVAAILRLAGSAMGAIGGVLLFVEFFQMPSYVQFDTEFESYNLAISPDEATEYTWIGRLGALAIALGFALQTFAWFLG
ncbi:MAG: hypothetical protein ABEJ77_04280 [Halanaeroarchaeum sp.]